MLILPLRELIQEYAKTVKKPCVYISWQGDFYKPTEVVKAAPYLDPGFVLQHDDAVVICDSYEEMEKVYGQTVGDDGPTTLNPYNGPAGVYALTCNAAGEWENENT